MSLELENHKLKWHLDRVAQWLSGDPVVPVTAEISPDSRCNHRCRMCGYEYLGHKRGRMPEAVLLKAARELPAAGVRGLVFAGDGEPFMNRATIPAMVAARKAGADVAASTNGALLTEKDFPAIAENLTWVRFSVNGGTPEAYAEVHRCGPETFEQVLSGIRGLVDEKERRGADLTVGVQLVLLPENIDTVENLAKRVRETGADYYVMKPFYHHAENPYGRDFTMDYGNRRDTLENVETHSRDGFTAKMRWNTVASTQRTYTRCIGWPFFIYVRTDGKVLPCLARHGEDRLVIGDLSEADFLKIWESDRKKEVAEVMAGIDVSECQPNCRHHAINRFLWEITHPGTHSSFV